MTEASSISNVVKASHHQADERYGQTRGIQCSCMALIAVCWSLFKKVSLWSSFELDSILLNGDFLFKALKKNRILDVEDLPQSFLIKDSIINIEYLENKTGEIILNAYLLSISEIISSCCGSFFKRGSGAILFINGYTLSIISGKGCFYIFDSHSRDENGSKSANGTAVLLKFNSLCLIDNYIKDTYYDGSFESGSLYYQIQFVRVNCSTADILKIVRQQTNLKKNLQTDSIKKNIYRKENDSSGQHFEQYESVKKFACKVTPASHHQSDERYGETRGIQCSCMALVAICWTLFKRVALWKTLDLDRILTNGNLLFKSIGKSRMLGVDDLPEVCVIENSVINFEYLANKTGEIMLNSYLISISGIISSTKLIGNGALLIISSYTLAILWGKNCFYIFDSHCKDLNGDIAVCGTAVLLKFNTLACIDDYIKHTYFNRKSGSLFYQIQFVRVFCSDVISSVTGQNSPSKRKLNIENCEKNSEVFTKKLKLSAMKTHKKFKDSNVQKFLSKVTEGPYYICTICHRSLYLNSVKKFTEKHHQDIDHDIHKYLQTSFDGNLYICNTCNLKLNKKKIPCQAVYNKLELQEIPDVLKSLKKLERILVSQRILFKKIVIMHGKGEFSKIKGSICNIPVEAGGVCKVLPRAADSNGLIIVKLKRDLKYRGHVYFEPVRPLAVYNALRYLVENNDLYADVTINDNLSSEEMVPDMNADQAHFEDCEENGSNLNSTSNETVLVSEVPNIVQNENLIVAPGQGKSPISVFNDSHCEELAFPYLLPRGRFGYKVDREIPLSPVKYFNQRLLNHSQIFASDPDYIFFARSVLEQHYLSSSINIAMHKLKPGSTAKSIRLNYKDTVHKFLADTDAFSFMSTIKGTPAYWKHFLYDVLAMVKQLGIPTYFLTLSSADLRWDELTNIINKLNNLNLSQDELRKLNYNERCKLLNSNPVLISRHFQYRVQVFFKEILVDGPLGKTTYYVYRIEFQIRGSPHVHSFLWIQNAPKLNSETEEEYLKFVENIISAQLPDPLEKPDLYNLVKNYQVHTHSKTCRKYNSNKCRFHYGRYFTDRTILAKPLPSDITVEVRNSVLLWRNQILEKVKKYIDEYLYPAKNNIDNCGTISDILKSLEIDVEDYYNALAISKDNDYELHLIRSPNSCFVNNYFEIGLLAWQANMDIQPVFNEYKAITYMCSYFSKSEDECSLAMRQAAKEAFEKKLDRYSTMRAIVRAYANKRECSVQEAVFHILPELHLRKIFPGVCFANTSIPEERTRILKTENELMTLPPDSTDVFKRNNIDRYISRPNKSFCNGLYKELDSFCLAEFLANYTLTSEKNESQEEYQPNILSDDIIEKNHGQNGYPKLIRLMNSNEKMRCRKVRRIIRYHVPNKNKLPEKYAHHLLFLFYPFRSEKELLSGVPPTYQTTLSNRNVLQVVNRNKQIFEPYGDIVEQAFVNFHANLSSYRNFDDSDNDETENDLNQDYRTDEIQERLSDHVSVSNFCLNTHSDEEIASNIRSLNTNQRYVFDIVHSWARDYIKALSGKTNTTPDPFYIFLSGSGGTGKSHVIKTIYQAVTKTLLYHSSDLDKPRVLLLGPTGISAVNINGTTIHSGLGIPLHGNMQSLSQKQKAYLKNKLSEVKLIIIDEISMVSSDLFLRIHNRLLEIFDCKTGEPFAGIPILVCGDFYQLPPVKGSPVYLLTDDRLEKLQSYELWQMFKLIELTEIMRQKDDIEFIELLNKVRIGNVDADVERSLKARFQDKNSVDFPSQDLHIFAENQPVNEHNKKFLSDLSGVNYIIEAIDNIPSESGCTGSVIEAARNQKQTKTGGLAKTLELKIGARVMLTVNIDVDDKLMNGQIGKVSFVKMKSGHVTKIYIIFDDPDVGRKKRASDQLACQTNTVAIERCDTDIRINPFSPSSPYIKRTQFPLALAWACTVHKVQGLTINKGVVGFDLVKQKAFNPGQMYVALSRIAKYSGLFLIGQYNKSAIRASKTAGQEYERLRSTSNLLLTIQEKYVTTNNSLTITLLNVRSLSKHVMDVVADNRLCNSDALCFTETQIHPNQSVSNIIQHLVTYQSIHFNNNIDPFLSVAYSHVHSVVCLPDVNYPGVSVFKLAKKEFSDLQLTVGLIYRKNKQPLPVFYELINYVIQSASPDILLGDFNIDYKNLNCEQIMSIYEQIVRQPTHLGGATIDHVYVKKSLLEEFHVTCSTLNIYFSDHDAVHLKLSHKDIDFHVLK